MARSNEELMEAFSAAMIIGRWLQQNSFLSPAVPAKFSHFCPTVPEVLFARSTNPEEAPSRWLLPRVVKDPVLGPISAPVF